MALQPMIGHFAWPPVPKNSTGTASTTSMLLDAAGEKCAFIFYAPRTGTLEKVGIRFGTVTTAQDIKVSFQDVSLTTGDPDEVVDQFRVIPLASIASNTFVETGIISDDGTDGGVKRSVTAGDLLAVVIEFDSTDGNLNILRWGEVTNKIPFASLKTGGTWAKSLEGLVMSLKYVTDGYVPILDAYVFSTVGTDAAFNSGSTPDEIGIIFQVPFKCRAIGAWIWADLDGSANVVLYDSDGVTPLSTVFVDADVRSGTTTDPYYLYFPAATLDINTDYRLTIKAFTGVSLTQQTLVVPSAGFMDCNPGGQNIHMTERTDEGAWTETTTERPFMGILIDQLSDDAGGETFPGSKFNQGLN